MEILILFEYLKIVWIGFQMWKHIENQKRHKALVESLTTINQRLENLEAEFKKLNP
jgi:hypothetical protein